jgi:hypothetical protein
MKLMRPARLQQGPLHLVERGDLLQARLAGDLLGRDALLAQVPLDDLAVLDQDQRLRLEQRAHPREAPACVGHGQGQQAEHPDREDKPGEGEIVLCHALLEQISHDDQEQQVERLERAQLATSDQPGQQEDEDEREEGADDDVHQGNTVTVRSTSVRRVSPS